MAAGPARMLLVAVGVALLPGCLALPPRVKFEAHQGLVRAETHHEARLVAEVLDELAPQVALLLPDTNREPVEVWVQQQLEVYRGWPIQREVPAFTIEGEGRIHMLGGERPEVSAALSHELVHALLGPSWSTLPPVAEEGLADWVQERLNLQYAASMRADHLVKAAASVGGLKVGLWLGWADVNPRLVGQLTFPEDEGILDPLAALEGRVDKRSSNWRPYEVSVSDPRLYGVGYLVVARIAERIGILGLHRLCVRAADEGLSRVPAHWLLEAADLDRNPDHWREIIVERFGGAELMALARSLVPELVASLVDEVEANQQGVSLRHFLRERPGVGLVGGRQRLSIVMIPDMIRQLRRAWPQWSGTAQRSTEPLDALSWVDPADWSREGRSSLVLGTSR